MSEFNTPSMEPNRKWLVENSDKKVRLSFPNGETFDVTVTEVDGNGE